MAGKTGTAPVGIRHNQHVWFVTFSLVDGAQVGGVLQAGGGGSGVRS